MKEHFELRSIEARRHGSGFAGLWPSNSRVQNLTAVDRTVVGHRTCGYRTPFGLESEFSDAAACFMEAAAIYHQTRTRWANHILRC